MRLSLSVRIAEGFLSKEEARLSLEEVATLARQAGYDGLCMRASQVGVKSTSAEVESARQILRRHDLPVTMVTGDFAIVYNNDQGPAMLREPEPYFALAEALGADLIRVAMKTAEDIPWARRSADLAAERGLWLAHQCHIQSLFETLDSIEHTLRAVDRPNFGLIFEPANLEQCGQEYGRNAIRRLAPWIFNVYLQNQALRAEGAVTLENWTRGAVSFDIIPIHEPGGIDFTEVFAGLREVGYDGPVTVHQSAPLEGDPLQSARSTVQCLRGLWES